VRVAAALLQTIDGDGAFEQEFRLLIGPSSFRWVLCRAHLLRNAAGRPERIAGTVIDVSASKQREFDLRRVAVMFESLSDGAFLTDRELAVVDLNSSAERLFSLTRSRALSTPLFRLLGAPNAAALETQAALEFAKEGRWSVELALGPDAEQTFELVAFPLRNEDDVVGAAFLFRDITERKKLQRQVAFYDRLSSLGTLSAGIAHEINNPLSFVVSSLEFVLDELGARPEAHQTELEALRDALEGARRISNTVRDMKILSRDDGPAHPEPTDARQQLELALKMTHKLVSSRAVLVRELAQPLPRVTANQSGLSQVFINLLVNAAQAIPEGRHGRIVVRQRAVDGSVLTEVTDDGVGIPAENLSRIFDPFFTTKPVGVGTGLGLSICHGLVTGFGGELRVDSEVGRGTTFTVKLPIAQDEVEVKCEVPVPAKRRAHLLLVDDEPLLLRALARNLSPLHDVSTAGSVDEALAQLRTGDFDMILCDLMMPERTGMDLYEELNRDRPELATRMVFVSGGAFTDRARDFVKQVPNLMITKPIDRAELANLVQVRLLDRTGPV
jgi:PAS domain S-box-containing protein